VALLYARPFGDAKVRAACGDVAGGFATVFAAAILAHIFNIPLGQWVPVVAAIWFAIHFALLRRAHELVRASMGVFCGWLAYSILLN